MVSVKNFLKYFLLVLLCVFIDFFAQKPVPSFMRSTEASKLKFPGSGKQSTKPTSRPTSGDSVSSVANSAFGRSEASEGSFFGAGSVKSTLSGDDMSLSELASNAEMSPRRTARAQSIDDGQAIIDESLARLRNGTPVESENNGPARNLEDSVSAIDPKADLRLRAQAVLDAENEGIILDARRAAMVRLLYKRLGDLRLFRSVTEDGITLPLSTTISEDLKNKLFQAAMRTDLTYAERQSLLMAPAQAARLSAVAGGIVTPKDVQNSRLERLAQSLPNIDDEEFREEARAAELAGREKAEKSYEDDLGKIMKELSLAQGDSTE